ncbi:hypothetical protein MNBD_ACTINO02-1234 [hydrothermal vent metagenome]|uniref:Uncharacterized protein n=1 Tax=hydrothermal vent metagenome TaxID=652676 RepID=A0A3B0SW22_9ZZZZ
MKFSLRLRSAAIALVLITAACGGSSNSAESVVDSPTENGTETIDVAADGGEVPADFPLPVAPDGTVGLTMNSPDGELYTITYPKDSFDELAAMYTEYMTNTPGEESVSTGEYEGLKAFFSTIMLDDGTKLSASISQTDTESIVTLGRTKNP